MENYCPLALQVSIVSWNLKWYCNDTYCSLTPNYNFAYLFRF